MLLNYETVKFFCNEALELEGYDSSLRQYQGAEYWQMAFLAMLAIVQGTVVWLGLVSGLVVCVRGVADGSLTIGDTVLFVTMINQLYIPLTYFGSYYRQVQKALIDMENMFELINTPPSVQDPPSGAQLVTTAGEVTFDNVVFRYKEKAPAVLKGVSFHVPGGQTLAVVGATGSGKSTILRLLLRFYDVNQGSVRIDGMDVRAVTQHSLRSAIAVVPQDCMLFNDTVLHNIKYGRVGATNAEVVEAARVAHIHESIETKFKKGYLTKVGERGLRLSGGEKQRVAFARAVVKNPAILVLDEATSALDSITESQIQDSLRQMRGRCTTVIVAHRLSTIMDADIILVLDKGRVTESGSHAQLIEQGGLYQMMWSRQKSKMDQADANDITAALDAVNGGEVTDTAALSPGCSDSDDSDAPTNAHNGHGSGGKGLKGSMTPGAAETEAEADADDTEAGGVSGADVPSPTDREEESQPLLPPFLSSSPAAKPNGARTQRAGGLGRKASSGTPTAASGLASAFARAPVPPELLVPEITSSGSSLPRGSTFARPTRPRSGAGPGTAAVSAAAAAAAGGASTSAVLGAGRRSSMGLGGRLGSDPGDAGDEAGGMDAEAEEADDTITDLCGAGGSGRPSDAWDSAVASPSGFGPRTDSFDRHPSPNRMRIMSRLGVARHGAHPSDFFEDSGIDTDGSGLLHQDASGVAIAQGGTRGSGESACSDSPELGEGASLLGARLGGDIEEGGPQ
ncbi:hypothetical protein FOA52_013356 [Chlamydomonas sp. UWO 241]|nr:hypothetical protein FOA52_013356 [Chlamydomonas sp. UWO 241]